MYDINYENIKSGKKFFYIFLIIGILTLIVIGVIFTFNITKQKSLDATVLSTNVEETSYIDDEGKRMYSQTYYYTVDGTNYTCKSSISTSYSQKDENKLVYYDSSNPKKCGTETSKFWTYFILIFITIPAIFIPIAIVNIIGINKRIKEIQELNIKGKLIKNLPYRLEDTNVSINEIPLKRIVVDYKLPNGEIKTLYGDTRHDGKLQDEDGMVDVLIDEYNPDNYFIDYEINRLSGNREEDYYKETKDPYTFN